MRRLLVCQHVGHEILGTLDPLFRGYGFRIRYANFGRQPDLRPSIDGYHALVVLGGPMNVDQVDEYPHLAVEVELIRTALERGIPILGICLGGQLIARALGATVGRSPAKEIGWYDVSPTPEALGDPLLRHFGAVERIFQWHGDAFEIPQGAVRLATSEGCPNQAFRYGENVYGLQFHLEVDAPMIDRWLEVPMNRSEVEDVAGPEAAALIRQETLQHIQRSKRLSELAFTELVRLFGIEGRRERPLRSR